MGDEPVGSAARSSCGARSSASATWRPTALLSTVIRNLLSNAVVHSDKPHPTVRLTVERRMRTALLSVSDDAPGIPESQADKLFQMGERGIDSSGTGLGLYRCRQIIESFGGKIWHDAAEGATFRVEVPLSEPEE